MLDNCSLQSVEVDHNLPSRIVKTGSSNYTLDFLSGNI